MTLLMSWWRGRRPGQACGGLVPITAGAPGGRERANGPPVVAQCLWVPADPSRMSPVLHALGYTHAHTHARINTYIHKHTHKQAHAHPGAASLARFGSPSDTALTCPAPDVWDGGAGTQSAYVFFFQIPGLSEFILRHHGFSSLRRAMKPYSKDELDCYTYGKHGCTYRGIWRVHRHRLAAAYTTHHPRIGASAHTHYPRIGASTLAALHTRPIYTIST
jgi:hypothetical protein